MLIYWRVPFGKLIMENHYFQFSGKDIDVLVGGWPTPLKHMKVSWDDYFQYMEK